MKKTSRDVFLFYRQKHTILQTESADMQARQKRILLFLGTCLLAIAASLFLIWHVHSAFVICVLALPCYGAATAIQKYGKSRSRMLVLARRSGFYERAIQRMEGRWHDFDQTGDEFARDDHPYQYDLNIIGKGSLYQLLCTTRSTLGAEKLASWLLNTSTLETAKARQEAVHELSDYDSLQEEIALLGRYQFQQCDRIAIQAWLSMPVLAPHRVLSVALLLSSLASGLLGILTFAAIVPWMLVLPWLLFLIVSQIAIGAVFYSRIRLRLRALQNFSGEFAILRQGLAWAERQRFHSIKLKELVNSIQQTEAVRHLHVIERLLQAVSQREKGAFYLVSLLLAAGTQLVFATERWRAHHQSNLEKWIDLWAEFDALSALACYAYEHPENTYPKLIDEPGVFEASGLGHPLLTGFCVRNDITLNASQRFYIISGSNMAGKSTILRAIGVNAILATAGAPVCAYNAHISLPVVYASISVADSLLRGKSKFLAEVKKLQQAIHSAQQGQAVLFLMDEILSGTNSLDRRIAAETVVRALMKTSAIGALSTHDLALTEIAAASEPRGINMHMESANPDDPLDFDYRLKEGVSRRSNALAIVKMFSLSSAGVP